MTPAFAPGSVVRIADDWPETRGPAHIRTPHYLRGKTGRVERCLGAFGNPEDIAFARPVAIRPLYHVAFEAIAVWPDATGTDLLVEVYEHWLEPLP